MDIACRMYGKCGSLEQVLQCFRRMNLEGLRPGDITFTTVLTSWSKFKNVDEVKEVHDQLAASGYESDLMLATELVHIYGKLQNFQDARLLFERTTNKDVVLWNAMLGAYSTQGLGREALDLYKQMDLEPNDTTYISVLEACSMTGSVLKGREVYSRILETGYDTNVQVSTSLVYMFGRCGKLDEARLVFDKMRERTIVSWTAMIATYAQQGHGEEALELFQELHLEGIQPDQIAFLRIIHSCSHSGLVEEGRTYFLKMIKEFIVPSVEHFVGVLDLLGRSGKLNDAEELIHSMPVEPGVVG